LSVSIRPHHSLQGSLVSLLQLAIIFNSILIFAICFLPSRLYDLKAGPAGLSQSLLCPQSLPHSAWHLTGTEEKVLQMDGWMDGQIDEYQDTKREMGFVKKGPGD
jgi:hypothetical protein